MNRKSIFSTIILYKQIIHTNKIYFDYRDNNAKLKFFNVAII